MFASRLAFVFTFCYMIFYTYAATTTTTTTTTTNKPEIRKCGISKPGGLIKSNATPTDNIKNNDNNKNQQKAGLGEFPWTVALYKGDIVSCAGSLITPSIVLTGAHCVKDSKPENIKIKAGLWDLNNQTEQYPIQERSLTQIISHPEYKNENKIIKNDIALLNLEKPVELSDHIGLACLAKNDHQEKSSKCFASGWGKEGKDGKSSNILKKLHLPIVSKEDCEKKLKEKSGGNNVVLTDQMICAGGEKASTCIGDGGAPLVCQTQPESENRYIQSGITSWGVKCLVEIPGVYTNIAKYRDWIDEQVKKLGGDSKLYTIA